MKTLLEILKQIREAIKEEKEVAKYKSYLAKVPVCIDYIQRLLDLQEREDLQIDIETAGGKITLRKQQAQPAFKSFRDRYNEKHK